MNRRGDRLRRGCVPFLVALLSFGLLVVNPGPLQAAESAIDSHHRLQNELGNIENVLALLEKELLSSVRGGPLYDIEKRFVDAQVYYDLRSHENASVLFFDLVENPKFKNNRKYLDAVYYLAMSLWHVDNYTAAKPYFEEVVRSRSSRRVDSLIHLVEMALNEQKTTDLSTLIGWIKQTGAERDSGVRYVLGKALYQLGQADDALAVFGRISAGHLTYVGAQYYMGVIYTQRKRFTEALARFELASVRREEDPENEEGNRFVRVRDQALLALGRIYQSQGQTDNAIDAYQRIDRHSDDFEVALYEMSWVYIHRKNISEALQTLEILLLIVQDNRLAAEANVLRARLLVENSRHEEAVYSYKDVVSEFSPIQRELERVGRSNEKLRAYFSWLLHRENTDYDIQRPLGERAANFIEEDENMSGLVGLFDAIGAERRDVSFSRRVAKQIKSLLDGTRRMEIFPQLQDGWARLMEAENHLFMLNGELLDVENKLYRSSLTGISLARAETIVAHRRSLERRFREDVPTTAADYKKREHFANNRFQEVEREAFHARQLLERGREQLQALEAWLSENVPPLLPGGSVNPLEAEARKTIETEREYLQKLYNALSEVQGEIELAQAEMADTELLAESEANIKNKVLAVQKKEHALYLELRNKLSAEAQVMASKLAKERRRVFSSMGDIGSLLRDIETQVGKRVARISQLLRKERQSLNTYRKAIENEEAISMKLASNTGYALIRAARDAVRDVVLEADVGLIDVAWQRKQKHTDRMRDLSSERNARIRDLDAALREIVQDENLMNDVEEGSGMVEAPVDGREGAE